MLPLRLECGRRCPGQIAVIGHSADNLDVVGLTVLSLTNLGFAIVAALFRTEDECSTHDDEYFVVGRLREVGNKV